MLRDFRVASCPGLSIRAADAVLNECPELRRLQCQQSWSGRFLLHDRATGWADSQRWDSAFPEVLMHF
eukprot:SM000095S24943  [mRNA]  locus=s95:34292:34495:+ [translate_table: standard]